MDIDFGARTIGGGNSFIEVDTTGGEVGDIFANTDITAIDFSSLTGLAENVFSAANITNSNFAGTNVTLNNLDGIIANTATTSVIFDDGSSAGNGSVTSGPREISNP